MQSHEDSDHAKKLIAEMDLPTVDFGSLREKARRMFAEGASEVTAGRPNETPIEEYDFKSVRVTKRPDDETGCLRVSLGGGKTAEGPVNYCVYRGDKNRCIALLKRCLTAMERGN